MQGYAPAQAVLASLYDAGRGVEQNDALAYEWSDLASVHLQNQLGALVRTLRDRAAQHLAPATLTAAQAAASQWKQGNDLQSPVLTAEDAAAAAAHPTLRDTGSGFVIGRSGEIATDNHVVATCREIRAHDAASKLNVLVHVLARDTSNDLAVLSGGGIGPRLKLQANPIQQGQSIATYGFPLAPVLAGTGNLTTGTVSSTDGLSGDPKTFQFSAPVQPGSSGGPVVDDSGAVVGIIEAKLNVLALAASTGDVAQNVNFASKAVSLRKLMDANGVGYEIAKGGGAHQTVELADTLQKASVKVECWR